MTEPCPPWLPARLPSHTDWSPMPCRASCRARCGVLRAAREVGRTAVRLARCAVADQAGPVSIPLGAPDTFESPVGAQRAVSFAELDLAQVRMLKDRYGSTINDVVLAVCSGALRTHLVGHGQDTEQPAGGVVPGLGPGSTRREAVRATSSRPCSCRCRTTCRPRWSGCAP